MVLGQVSVYLFLEIIYRTRKNIQSKIIVKYLSD